MERKEILDQLSAIFMDTLEENNIVLTDSTTAKDIELWDSLTNIQLVVAIERHFKVRFASKEIQSWANVGEMTDSIMAKIAQ